MFIEDFVENDIWKGIIAFNYDKILSTPIASIQLNSKN